MKLWIFLDVCFNHHKVEVIFTTILFNLDTYAKTNNTQRTWNCMGRINN